ncbi:MAG TPA: MFS transporter [Ktedonobacterales bacterium]|nr:MFS transporter [Ktedonobacterales bacterium]
MADLRRAPGMPESHESSPERADYVEGARARNDTGYLPAGGHPVPRSTSDQHRAVNPSAPAGSRGFMTLLRNKLFLRLWMAQLISQTIMNAANYAMIVLVTNESNSALATSGAIVAFSLPALFFGAPAGVLVDRFDRRLVLWVSNVLRALATVVFIFALIFASGTVWPVYALTFFIALVGQFFTPAEGAAIPRLVHRQELMNALALFNITFTLAQAAGLIVIGPIALLLMPTFRIGGAAYGVTVTPVIGLFVIITLLYLVCALLVIAIPKSLLRSANAAVVSESGVRRRHQGARLRGIWSGIMESYRFIRSDAVLHISVWQLTLAGVIVSIVAMIAPRFVQVFFNKPAAAAALVFIPAGVGLVIGSALTPTIARRLRYARTITAGVIALAGSITFLVIGYAVAPYIFGEQWWSSWGYLGVMFTLTFLIGIGLDLINVPAQTMVQERSPDWVKGRVLAVQIMLLNAIIVVFVPAIGWVADYLGLSAALLVVAGAVGIAGLLSVYLGARTGAGGAELGNGRRNTPEGNA